MSQEKSLELIAHNLERIADSLESISEDIAECFGSSYGKEESNILEVIADKLNDIYTVI